MGNLATPRRQVIWSADDLRVVLVDREGAPDDLDDLGAELVRELVRRLFGRYFRASANLDLYQLFCPQNVAHGLAHSRRQTMLTDVDDGIEVVRFGPKRRAFLSGEAHASINAPNPLWRKPRTGSPEVPPTTASRRSSA